jgi:hypothetical protein
MTAWLIRLRDRPIAEGERRRAFIVSTGLLTLTVGLLALTSPTPTRRVTTGRYDAAGHTLSGPASAVPAPANADGTPSWGVLSPSEADVARRFLAGYLAYLYGHGGVAGVRDASPALVRSLAAHPPRVSIDIRARQPRLVALAPVAAPTGVVGVSALVGDGGVADYPVVLFISERGGRLLVTALGEA